MKADTEERPDQQLTRSVAKAFSILQAFSERAPRLSLSDLCASVDLSPSTLRRLLATLESLGYVQHDSLGLYRLGGRALSLAAPALAGDEVRNQSLPVLEDLSGATGGLNSNVGTLYEGRLLYLASVARNVTQRAFGVPGRLSALHSTALGKVMLAYRPMEDAREIIEKGGGLVRRTPKTIATWEDLEEELARVRERGYAVDDEEATAGGLCVAAPVRDRSAEVVAALSASGMVWEISQSRIREIAAQVVSHALTLSYKLGYVLASEW